MKTLLTLGLLMTTMLCGGNAAATSGLTTIKAGFKVRYAFMGAAEKRAVINAAMERGIPRGDIDVSTTKGGLLGYTKRFQIRIERVPSHRAGAVRYAIREALRSSENVRSHSGLGL